MGKRIVDLRTQTPILDIASYGRRGPGQKPAAIREDVLHAIRTARGAPEVVVRVTGGARTTRGVGRHLDYIGREGEGEVETDEGLMFHEKGFEKSLIEDWDLDLERHQRYTQRAIAAGRKPPKLVHNLVFSMHRGTPPDKLYKAVQKFALEKFALQHRYAMALHTDQGHPHVHVVVKAVSEQGVRLNIRKATLREWRRDFARYLRELGIEANATERAVRGSPRRQLKNGMYWANERQESTYVQRQAATAARSKTGRDRLWQTRREVERGWHAFAEVASQAGMQGVADQVKWFVERMPPVCTGPAWIAHHMGSPMPREQAPPTR